MFSSDGAERGLCILSSCLCARVCFQVHACGGRVCPPDVFTVGADEYLIVCLARAPLPLFRPLYSSLPLVCIVFTCFMYDIEVWCQSTGPLLGNSICHLWDQTKGDCRLMSHDQHNPKTLSFTFRVNAILLVRLHSTWTKPLTASLPPTLQYTVKSKTVVVMMGEASDTLIWRYGWSSYQNDK